MQNYNFRVNIDNSEDQLGTKIKQARLDRVAYLGIIGDNELNNNTLTLRKADQKENREIEVTQLIEHLNKMQDNDSVFKSNAN